MADRDPLLWPPEDDAEAPEIHVAPGQVPIFEDEDEQPPVPVDSPREGNEV